MSEVQTLTLGGKQFVVVERAAYERLRRKAGDDSAKLPALPTPNAAGHIPAVEYAQASLARRAGIRPETLNRIEKGKSTPDTSTVEKLVRALERAEATTTEKR